MNQKVMQLIIVKSGKNRAPKIISPSPIKSRNLEEALNDPSLLSRILKSDVQRTKNQGEFSSSKNISGLGQSIQINNRIKVKKLEIINIKLYLIDTLVCLFIRTLTSRLILKPETLPLTPTLI